MLDGDDILTRRVTYTTVLLLLNCYFCHVKPEEREFRQEKGFWCMKGQKQNKCN